MKKSSLTQPNQDEFSEKIAELTLELQKTVKKAELEAMKEISKIMKKVDQQKLARLRNKKF